LINGTVAGVRETSGVPGRPIPEARIAELRLAAEPAAWERVGFSVVDGSFAVGSVPISFGAETGWTVTGLPAAELDGLPTRIVYSFAAPEPAEHPIGATRIDHVVVLTPTLERTTAAFERAGIRCRRVREDGGPTGGMRQAFFRLGEVIVEAVEVPGEPGDPARFWGVTFAVADLDAAAERLGDLCAPIRDAVQPGRRIAPLKREAGLGLPVALISD